MNRVDIIAGAIAHYGGFAGSPVALARHIDSHLRPEDAPAERAAERAADALDRIAATLDRIHDRIEEATA